MNDECSLNIQSRGCGDLLGFGPTPDGHRDRPHQRADLGIGEGRLGQRRERVTGRQRVEADPVGRPRRGGAADPARQRQLDARVRHPSRPDLRRGARLVTLEARGHEGVVDRRNGGRARRHRDRGGGTTPGERAAQALEHRDAAEVADVDELRGRLDGRGHPGEAGVPVEGPVAPLHDSCDRGLASRGGAEVGEHLGVAQVDADDAPPLGLQPTSGRGADARCRSRQRNTGHRPPACGRRSASVGMLADAGIVSTINLFIKGLIACRPVV